ncbi:MAG: hypothetical protein M0004_03550 [Actinomycetota bacterium]|nr:hypothetical protein [Actinomycetota bacterium]
MFGFLDAAAMRAMRRFVQRTIGGDPRYAVLALAAVLVHLALRPEKPKTAREQLALGETLVVRHLPPPPTRRQRRKQARTEARADAAATSE